MLYIVLVDFLSGGALPPDEFFRRINARWSCLEEPHATDETSEPERRTRRGICIAEMDSIQQFSIDISIMPGVGIANIEVMPLAAADPALTRD